MVVLRVHVVRIGEDLCHRGETVGLLQPQPLRPDEGRAVAEHVVHDGQRRIVVGTARDINRPTRHDLHDEVVDNPVGLLRVGIESLDREV